MYVYKYFLLQQLTYKTVKKVYKIKNTEIFFKKSNVLSKNKESLNTAFRNVNIFHKSLIFYIYQ